MKLFFLALLLLNTSVLFSQQNLIPNAGFELYYSDDTCEAGFLNSIPPWQTAIYTSPNCFKECCTVLSWGIPVNMFGYQYAHNGIGYAGFGTYDMSNGNYREYIEVKLSSSLIENQKYQVQFYTSLAEKSRYATSFGVYFSDTLIHDEYIGYYSQLNFEPQIETPKNDSVITDMVNWILVSSIYCAHGGEQFITIGNFDNDINIDTMNLHTILPSGFPKYAYYYIDDVSVSLIGDCFPKEIDDYIFMPNAFSPNDDLVNDILYIKSNNIIDMNLCIYSRWGEKVFESNDINKGWDGRYKNKLCNTGVFIYLFRATLKNGLEVVKKGNVTLVR